MGDDVEALCLVMSVYRELERAFIGTKFTKDPLVGMEFPSDSSIARKSSC